MAKYKANWDIKHNGAKYAPGSEIELTEKEAKSIGRAVTKVAVRSKGTAGGGKTKKD